MKAAQKAANKLIAAQKKSRMEEIRTHKRLRTDAWEAARLDNETLLETWEAAKLAAHESNLDLPLKPQLALWWEVYELADGPAEAVSLVEDNAVPSEGEESSMV